MRDECDDDEQLDRIADICRWYAVSGPPTAQRQAAALAELAHITCGRAALLARHAGEVLARHDTRAGARDTAHERIAQLCITAGADMSLIEQWRQHKSITRQGTRPPR